MKRSTKTPPARYCLGVASSVKAMMTRLDTDLTVTSQTFTEAFVFTATEVDTLNKRVLREVPVKFKAGRTLYFVASTEMPGWFYVIMTTPEGMGCSCKRRGCPHLEMLQQSKIGAVA